jgi:mono/diheme cytochrome c family protein
MRRKHRYWKKLAVGLLVIAGVGGLAFLSSGSRSQVRADDAPARDAKPGDVKPVDVNASDWNASAVKLASDPAAADAEFREKVTPLLKTYCYSCHGDGANTGGLALDSYKTAASITADPKTWDKLYRYVRTHQMPPSTEEQPTDEQRKEIYSWVDAQLNHYYTAHPDPGRITIHRLNKSEYNNTIRDLLGMDVHPADDFPMDDSGYGFDNIADVLSLPPMLMEKYLTSATKILDEAIATEPVVSKVTRTPASLAEVAYYSFGDRGDGWVRLNSGNDGYCAVDVDVPAAGEYIMRILSFARIDGDPGINGGSVAAGIQGKGPMTASLQLEKTVVKQVPIVEDEAHPQVYEMRVAAPAGKQRFQVVVHHYRGGDNEDIVSNAKIGRDQPGPIFIKYIEIEGPLPHACAIYSAMDLKANGPVEDLPDGTRKLTGESDLSVPVDVAKDSTVTFRVTAEALRAGTDPAQLELRADGKAIEKFDVLAPALRLPLPSQNGRGGRGGGGGGQGGPGGGNPGRLPAEQRAGIPQMYEITTNLPAGKHVLSAAFVNPFSDPKNADPNLVQRAIIVLGAQVVNESQPPARPPMPEIVRQMFVKHGVDVPVNVQADAPLAGAFGDAKSAPSIAAARGIIADFAFRAWRRPVPEKQLDGLMRVYGAAADHGETFFGSVKLAMEAVLISPRFLFRGTYDPGATIAGNPAGGAEIAMNSNPAVNLNPPANSNQPGSSTQHAISDPTASLNPAASTQPAIGNSNAGGMQLVDEYALASRLSYFLWSSTPDDELLDLAGRGELRKNLPAQVKRMLADPKAQALVENFGGQWLQFRGLETFEPAKTFTKFDPALQAAIKKEPELFFNYIMRQDQSVVDFIDADYTFANQRLAEFYGISGVTGDDFQKVSLEGTPRRGILTEAGILLLTSNPTRTSPVKRGKWVLENVLGAPPPPPPPNIPALDDVHRQLTGTLRQRLEQHRANPLCASCHAIMDPIGFGLENFDAIGDFRTLDVNKAKIDSTGTLITGESFDGAIELSKVLSTSRREDFVSCLSEKMLTYALGRGVEYYDRATLDEIIDRVEKGDDRFSSLIDAIVMSTPFQMQRVGEKIN